MYCTQASKLLCLVTSNISKIPKELIDNFEFNQDKNYNFYFEGVHGIQFQLASFHLDMK